MKEHFCGVDSMMFTDTPRKKKTALILLELHCKGKIHYGQKIHKEFIYSSRCHYGRKKGNFKEGNKVVFATKMLVCKNTFRSEKRHFNVNTELE